MLEIYMIDETNSINDEILKLVSSILKHAATEEGISGEAEVSVTFMSDDEIQKVNNEYRSINEPTDVISFALEEMSEGEIAVIAQQGIPIVLGDIIISVETALRQAGEYGHDVNREIGFLALHGFLHLLGYDHLIKDDEVKMFDRQKEILHSYGLER